LALVSGRPARYEDLALRRASTATNRTAAFMMRFAFGLAVFAGLLSPARASSCAEGIEIIEQIAERLDLSAAERSKVKSMLAKVKAVDQPDHEHECKAAAAGVIRFFLVRSVLE
jgi:demethoxyubiquinone hydroxylase (CLK1/Coq7/Cat5 family)